MLLQPLAQLRALLGAWPEQRLRFGGIGYAVPDGFGYLKAVGQWQPQNFFDRYVAHRRTLSLSVSSDKANALPFRRGPLLAVAWSGLFGLPERNKQSSCSDCSWAV
jgi:hypothetical protein